MNLNDKNMPASYYIKTLIEKVGLLRLEVGTLVSGQALSQPPSQARLYKVVKIIDHFHITFDQLKAAK